MLQRERFLEVAANRATRGINYLRSQIGKLWQKFITARVVDLWNGLADGTGLSLTRDSCCLYAPLASPSLAFIRSHRSCHMVVQCALMNFKETAIHQIQ